MLWMQKTSVKIMFTHEESTDKFVNITNQLNKNVPFLQFI